MADKRKLNSEIDRTLKRVQEGRLAFQDILDKYESSGNQTQKEKFEADLKKEIKKLQRLRDQIKTWLASSDVKDKNGLLDVRKQIESDMERFKVIEKETKTKAYSKEGLSSFEMKKDPYSKDRCELDEWLKNSIASLKSHTEKYEFDIESLLSTVKKKRVDKEKQTAIEDKKGRLEICNFHIEKLETIMRLLDNEKISVEKVKQIKSGVDYILETVDDLSFIDDKTLYDDLGLDELLEQNCQQESESFQPSSTTSSRLATGDSSDYSVDGPSSNKSNLVSNCEDGKFDFPSQQVYSASSTSTPIKTVPLNATVSTAAKTGKQSRTVLNQNSPDLANQTAPPQLLNSNPAPNKNPVKNTSSSSSTVNEEHPSPHLANMQPAEDLPFKVAKSDHEEKSNSPIIQNSIPSAGSPSPPITTSNSVLSSTLVNPVRSNNSLSHSSNMSDNQNPNLAHMHPKEAAAPFRNKQLDITKASSFPIEMQSQLQKLECAFLRLPNPCDTEKARMIVCKNITNIPPYYPREPQKSTDTEEYFMKLDTQTLFFIFYYFEGTKAQYLAAKSLKRMSWRFHTKLMMWFQRHEEPKQITDEFESGTYIYYDYKTMTQRKKDDFVFQYSYLEDKDF